MVKTTMTNELMNFGAFEVDFASIDLIHDEDDDLGVIVYSATIMLHLIDVTCDEDGESEKVIALFSDFSSEDMAEVLNNAITSVTNLFDCQIDQTVTIMGSDGFLLEKQTVDSILDCKSGFDLISLEPNKPLIN